MNEHLHPTFKGILDSHAQQETKLQEVANWLAESMKKLQQIGNKERRLKALIERIIRKEFDGCVGINIQKDLITLAENYGLDKLAEQMKSDYESENGFEFDEDIKHVW